jgi:hypothetical protein
MRDAVQRWRLVLHRDALQGETAHRSVQAEWEAALGRSGMPLAGLDAPRPKPRFALAAPLGSAIPGEAELLDLWLVERLPRWHVREALLATMPAGHRLVELYDVWLGEPALPGRVAASVYRATLDAGAIGVETLRAAAAALLGAGSLPRERRKGDATVAYDLRPFLAAIQVEPGPAGGVVVRLTLRHDPEKGLGRPDEALAALGEQAGTGPLLPTALVREGLVLAQPVAAEPAPRRVPGRRPADRVDRPRR